jgi:hypothetical protein
MGVPINIDKNSIHLPLEFNSGQPVRWRNSITRLSDKSLSGKVNAAATSIGPYAFADGIKSWKPRKRSYAIVHPSRLAGLTLSNDSIRYYVLDGKGRIRVIILNDVTGDLYDYGIITDVKETEGNMSTFGSYQIS